VRIIFFHGDLGLKCFKRPKVRELTEAQYSSRYSCSKLLLIDVNFIRLIDEVLFTLTTLK